MDLERQDTSTKIKRAQQEFRLKLRKERIEEALWAKRNPIKSIKGYDLGKYAHKRKHKKRCWVCGSYTHLKVDCPIQEKNKL